jgi:ABC-type dipeptide/oligopeptide/nickel transport system permease subunit
MVGPLVWTIDPARIDIRRATSARQLAHPFGTDQLGRDTLARVMMAGASRSPWGWWRWPSRWPAWER